MYKIEFYCDKNGKEPVLQYLEELASKNDNNIRCQNDNNIRCLSLNLFNLTY